MAGAVNEVRLGVIAPLSGREAEWGRRFSAGVEAAVKQANAEPDVGKRHALFLAANKILEAEQPYTALYNPTDLWLVKPNVVGLEHEGMLDQFHIGEASFK